MEYDPMSLRPGQRMFSLSDIKTILKNVEDMGLPLEAGSFLEQLTLDQLELLTHGVYDA
jgi:hypothetical protein